MKNVVEVLKKSAENLLKERDNIEAEIANKKEEINELTKDAKHVDTKLMELVKAIQILEEPNEIKNKKIKQKRNDS